MVFWLALANATEFRVSESPLELFFPFSDCSHCHGNKPRLVYGKIPGEVTLDQPAHWSDPATWLSVQDRPHPSQTSHSRSDILPSRLLDMWEVTKGCSFKPHGFGVVCYTAVANWYTWYISSLWNGGYNTYCIWIVWVINVCKDFCDYLGCTRSPIGNYDFKDADVERLESFCVT